MPTLARENVPIASNDRAFRRTASAPGTDQRRPTVPLVAFCRVCWSRSSRAGSANGMGRSTAAYTALNVVVAAAMPNASVTTQRAVVPETFFMPARTGGAVRR